MRSREALVRLKRFQVEERRRQVVQIETMVAEFERMAKDLDDQVAIEQERSGIHDASHFAYPTFAKAASQRRDNLRASAEELRGQLEAAGVECAEAMAELGKLESLLDRDPMRESAEPRAASAGGR